MTGGHAQLKQVTVRPTPKVHNTYVP